MLTVRHVEKLWNGRKFERLLDELLSPRVEALAGGLLGGSAAVAAAALTLVRLEEMNQSHVAICPKLIRAILAHRQLDGGWGDVAVTALCLRALCQNQGDGAAIDRGMEYLAMLQQPDGIWPRVPLRRMPADAMVSAFVLLQLGDNEKFRESVQFDAAVEWFEMHQGMIESAAQTLWRHARIRTAPAARLSSPKSAAALPAMN